jgi:hypothetical protein
MTVLLQFQRSVTLYNRRWYCLDLCPDQQHRPRTRDCVYHHRHFPREKKNSQSHFKYRGYELLRKVKPHPLVN